MKALLDDRRVLLPVLLTALAIAIGSVLIVMLSADASDNGSSAAAAAPSAGVGDGVTIDITDFKYKPASLTIKKGSNVSWVNRDSAPHNAVASGNDGFDTGTLKNGDKKTVTLSSPGTYAYICTFHPFMKATVTVR